MNVIVKKNTKGKSTDRIIKQILSDVYMDSKSFNDFYIAIKSLLEESQSMHVDIKEHKEKASGNLIEEMEKKYNFDSLIEGAFTLLQGPALANLSILLASKYKSDDIEEKYGISNVTVKKRLIEEKFFDKKLVKEKNYNVLYLAPNILTLIFLAFYKYATDIDKDQNNHFHRIVTLFEGK